MALHLGLLHPLNHLIDAVQKAEARHQGRSNMNKKQLIEVLRK